MKIFVIGQTMIDAEAIDSYLTHVGVSSERRQSIRQQELAIASHLDRLVELEGRLCYKSWEPGLNPNVQRIREDTARYLSNIIESGHGSVLEHAWINFILSGVSRVFTHELVRHRAGTAFSQESMRFVRVNQDAPIRDTPYLDVSTRTTLEVHTAVLMGTIDQIWADIDSKEHLTFEQKKKITSDLRSFIPMGVLTEIGFSANIRALRHMIEARTHPGAEQEIREIFGLVAEKCIEIAPHLFADFERREDGSWVPLYSKV